MFLIDIAKSLTLNSIYLYIVYTLYLINYLNGKNCTMKNLSKQQKNLITTLFSF